MIGRGQQGREGRSAVIYGIGPVGYHLWVGSINGHGPHVSPKRLIDPPPKI